MRSQSVAISDIGRRRKSNEDAFFRDDELCLYIVADGMGGHAAGEVAAGEAIDTIHGMINRGRSVVRRLIESPDDDALRAVKRLLESSVQAATYMVYALAELEPDQAGMGTTISALLVAGERGIIAQVGDSRVYLVREGQAQQLTEDHTLIAWQIREGLITKEEARSSPHRNVITRAVGNRDYVEVDTSVVELLPGDRLLLCSDGLHGYLDEAEIPAIADLGIEGAARRFVSLANERGGRDNITVVFVQMVA
jgi:PPM family protein phosphatase